MTAQPSFKDDIGGSAAWQVEQAIKRAGDQLAAPTRRMVRQALPTLTKAIELLCPAIMESTPEGLRTYYGPTPELDDGQLIIFVTNNGNHAAGNYDWLPDEAIAELEANIKAELPSHRRSDSWGAVYSLITTTALTAPLLRAWLLLLGVSGKTQFIQEAKRLRAAGYLPAIWAIAVSDETERRSGGMTGMLALPPAYVPYDSSNSPHAGATP